MEQALIVHLKLTGDQFGSSLEREAVFALEDQLEELIASESAGEFDGDDFGDYECVLYMYGPDADRLFTIIEPILKSSSLAKGGFAIKRYGEASDPNASEVRVTW